MLRESYRHEGKVKHRTDTNLYHCSEEEIAAFKLSLRPKGDLAKVERAFRSFKIGHLEIRPTLVHTEASTRRHVFAVMAAFLLERELAHYWRHLDLTVSGAMDELGSVRGI